MVSASVVQLHLLHTLIFIVSSQVRTPDDHHMQPFANAAGRSATGFHGLVPKEGCPQPNDTEGTAVLPSALRASQSYDSFVLGLILHNYSLAV